ncbi:uncharacterized protein EDB91DRAFT_1174030 [Suillus paluster]|uniref:uncharacterized protein n=1 Tax=Suillus paluster TaxID=48578 RepID=UPI001B85DA8F|nr:uncharacterized protein EDB91DRAFT_1174030 [Suillus paluster]KAG1722827.1 hypothetical protein EDB91DRAFT_1174030 [Suillus paluster]
MRFSRVLAVAATLTTSISAASIPASDPGSEACPWTCEILPCCPGSICLPFGIFVVNLLGMLLNKLRSRFRTDEV